MKRQRVKRTLEIITDEPHQCGDIFTVFRQAGYQGSDGVDKIVVVGPIAEDSFVDFTNDVGIEEIGTVFLHDDDGEIQPVGHFQQRRMDFLDKHADIVDDHTGIAGIVHVVDVVALRLWDHL